MNQIYVKSIKELDKKFGIKKEVHGDIHINGFTVYIPPKKKHIMGTWIIPTGYNAGNKEYSYKDPTCDMTWHFPIKWVILKDPFIKEIEDDFDKLIGEIWKR